MRYRHPEHQRRSVRPSCLRSDGIVLHGSDLTNARTLGLRLSDDEQGIVHQPLGSIRSTKPGTPGHSLAALDHRR